MKSMAMKILEGSGSSCRFKPSNLQLIPRGNVLWDKIKVSFNYYWQKKKKKKFLEFQSKREHMDHLIQHCQSVEKENNFAKDKKIWQRTQSLDELSLLSVILCFLCFIYYTILTALLSGVIIKSDSI